MIDSRRGSAVVKKICYTSLVAFFLIISVESNGQRQFKLREMRGRMETSLETYSFGFSWDNRTAFESLYQIFDDEKRLVSNPFYFSNRMDY